ncbi:PREDICTED: uncharacterized protein C1orf43 homolog [Thamnophis sirtalis]|uniref:Uncharacterized protein C1orf43 homolog n=1 Tax=Thamnophis sirtalis TaxID=35019 RepID=A0A6I9XTN5_9SAUR|nr:PREDICTED: uncharacterized protein C1orf43 homolog [Thamnophis sirtalis]
MRFAMKSRRGPHVPVGQHAPKVGGPAVVFSHPDFGGGGTLVIHLAHAHPLISIKARGESSQRQHQSAAKDLTLSSDSSSPTIQVTYLPSSQKSKRAKHFLELKSFKDNYNTLESTL